MKAVVTQIVRGHAVLLTEEGTFLRVRDQRYRIGQRISIARPERRPLRSLLVAAYVLAIGFVATAYAAQNLPFSYVSVDVNPSIRMTLNWYDRVHSLEAVNEDAEPIVAALSQTGVLDQPIEDAMQVLYSTLESNAYFSGAAENDVILAVASLGLKDVGSLTQQLADIQTVEPSGTPLHVETVQSDAATVSEAETYHTTAGRLTLAKSAGNAWEADPQTWLTKPVGELQDAAAQAAAVQTLPSESVADKETTRLPAASPSAGEPKAPEQALSQPFTPAATPESMPGTADSPAQPERSQAAQATSAPSASSWQAAETDSGTTDAPQSPMNTSSQPAPTGSFPQATSSAPDGNSSGAVSQPDPPSAQGGGAGGGPLPQRESSP